MVRLYCFLRLNLNTMILSPRPCSAILPVTFALASASPRTNSFESFEIASTRLNSTGLPTSPASVSTSMVWAGDTRYCLPPVSITAYIFDLCWVYCQRQLHSGMLSRAHEQPYRDSPNFPMI